MLRSAYNAGTIETLVETELAWHTNHPTQRPIARRLTEQHRMHPAIAKIVSDCFYEGALQTNPRVAEEFRTLPPPVRSIRPDALPETPIVFIDMPHGRERYGYKGGDSPPAWSNADEVEAVARTLALLRPRDDARPSLAVLSPYQQQVKRLRSRISNPDAGELAHLGAF